MEMNLHKKELTESVGRQMTEEIENAIDYLVDNDNEDDSEHYPLTLLKKLHQSTKPMKVKGNHRISAIKAP